MRKLVTVLVIAMFLVSMVPVGQPAIADEQQMGLLRYSYTDGITATLSISGSTASCSGKVTPASSSYKASITVTLYRSTDGSTWSKVDSWSGTTSASGTKTLTSGYIDTPIIY